MELTISRLDPTLIPTYGLLGAAYTLLLNIGGDALDDALGQLDATRDDLQRVTKRYLGLKRFEANDPASFDAVCVLTHLLGTWGRLSGASRAGFEVEMKQEVKKLCPDEKPLLVPFWVPSVATVNHNRLLFPLVAATRTSALCAYEGLVQHLRTLGDDPSEIALTAVLWRVVALSDGLAPDKGGAAARLNALHWQVTHDASVSYDEKRHWDPLTAQFANSRDALTHMKCDRNGEVFEAAVANVMAGRDGLVPAATALGFAVLQDIGLHLSDEDAPMLQWERARAEHEWVDDQL